MEKVTTYDPKKGKPILAGHIEGDSFIKQVTPRHFFYKLQAYGIQEEVIQTLIEKKIKKIQIISHTLTYESDIKDWVNGHVLIRDYGNGLQRFLPVHYMKKIQRGS
jgi:hypothetical protein